LTGYAKRNESLNRGIRASQNGISQITDYVFVAVGCHPPEHFAERYLELLGPLAWPHLPERNLRRNWGQATIPYATFIAAYLVKLNEGHGAMGDLRRFLAERPALGWLLGFPLDEPPRHGTAR